MKWLVLLLLVGCSKGSLPSLPANSLSLTVNGAPVRVGAITADTTASIAGPYRPNIVALARVLLPGLHDSSGLEIFLFGGPGTYASSMSGYFYDTSSLYTFQLALVPFNTGGVTAASDYTIRRSFALIGSNNGLFVTGVFQGALRVSSGVYPGGDSLIVGNGSFTFRF